MIRNQDRIGFIGFIYFGKSQFPTTTTMTIFF